MYIVYYEIESEYQNINNIKWHNRQIFTANHIQLWCHWTASYQKTL